MTQEGRQTIQRAELIKCIRDARRDLPELLGYTKVSPPQFIDQVEERSGVLIQQGMEEDHRGNIVPCYEFSHLSFQEYLTAKAIAENWLPENEDRTSLETYLSILQEHYDETQWWEVIPLTAVLLKREARPAMEYLLSECRGDTVRKLSGGEKYKKEAAVFHLANCIACEVPLLPEILEPALLEIARQCRTVKSFANKRSVQGMDMYWENIIPGGITSDAIDVFTNIYHSEKYGHRLKTVVENELLSNAQCRKFSGVLTVWCQICDEEHQDPDMRVVLQMLKSTERRDRVKGALFMGNKLAKQKWDHAYILQEKKDRIVILSHIFFLIKNMLYKEDIGECFAAVRCVALAGRNEEDMIPKEVEWGIVRRILQLWCMPGVPFDLAVELPNAICALCYPGMPLESSSELSRTIAAKLRHPVNVMDKQAAICLSLLLGKMTVEECKKTDNGGYWRALPRRFRDEIAPVYPRHQL